MVKVVMDLIHLRLLRKLGNLITQIAPRVIAKIEIIRNDLILMRDQEETQENTEIEEMITERAVTAHLGTKVGGKTINIEIPIDMMTTDKEMGPIESIQRTSLVVRETVIKIEIQEIIEITGITAIIGTVETTVIGTIETQEEIEIPEIGVIESLKGKYTIKTLL